MTISDIKAVVLLIDLSQHKLWDKELKSMDFINYNKD